MPERTTRYSGDYWDQILQEDINQIFPIEIEEKRKPRSGSAVAKQVSAAKTSPRKSKPRAA